MRAFLEPIFLSAWQRRGWLAILLSPFALIFWLLLQCRTFFYKLGFLPSTRVRAPVIIVGNIFVGGTGKTPMVIWLVQQLQQAGWHPGVISRGYRAVHSAGNAVREVRHDSLASDVGDEPLLIAQRTQCPVMIGRQRVASAQALLAAHPAIDVIISDDGLQHQALARDIEIVMMDQRGNGNGWLLPAGPLRESASRQRDFTIFNASQNAAAPYQDTKMVTMHLVPSLLYALSNPNQSCALAAVQGQRIIAAAGIGNPERFFSMLERAGLQFTRQAFPDHHAFTAHSFREMAAEIILITEKDAVKCRQIPALVQDTRIWVVPVDAQLETGFAQQLLELISEKKNGCTFA